VAVQVEDHGNFSPFGKLSKIFFDVVGLMHIFGTAAALPSSVEVIAKKIGSVVSSSNPIRVDHR
jgi:hypothetical protein